VIPLRLKDVGVAIGRDQLLAQDALSTLHRSFPHELRGLLMHDIGGSLDAVQGRFLRAKLDALRLDCHDDASSLGNLCTVNVRTLLEHDYSNTESALRDQY